MNVAKNQLSTTKFNNKSISPYPHQKAAINDAIKEFKKADRTTIIMPCGTGKTLVCLWIAEKLKVKTVVVFVPSLALIHQVAMEWAMVASIPLSLMAICSDQTVALDEDGIIVEKDEFWFPVLSETSEIKKFLKTTTKNKEMKIVFCTYHSSFTLSGATGNFSFDFGVFDEAHRTAVKGESHFSAPLFDEYVAINKRLFVTATPKQYALNKKNGDDDFEAILSMDNEDIYGKHCHVLSFRKAIEKGIISDYKIIFPEVTSKQLADNLQKHDVEKVSESAIFNAAMQVALKKAIKETGASKIITFHTRVADADNFAVSLTRSKILSAVKIAHVNGRQTSVIRKSIMYDFEIARKSLITNARCLTEGIDAPAVDMVVIFSNKKSKIDIIQAIGRALRKHPNKLCGYIMVPVFVDRANGETYEEALNRPDNQVLFELLLALEQHDELLSDAIRKSKFDEGYNGKESIESLSRFFNDSTQRCLSSEQFRKALSIAIIDRLGSNWDKMFGCLIKFKEQYGHCNVPCKFKAHLALANWVSRVRQFKKKGLLSKEKITGLNKVGFNWEPHDATWKQRIGELKAFKQQYGHCNVPYNFHDNKILAKWVANIRLWHKQGKLPVDRFIELSSLGFIWERLDTIWQQRVIELKKFKTRYGHCLVPLKFKYNPMFGRWVNTVRYLKKKGGLSRERIKELDNLGFVWDPLEAIWQQRLVELKEYKKQYGHCNVPQRFKNNPVLANWVCGVRKSRKKGILSKLKIKELSKIGFVWNGIK